MPRHTLGNRLRNTDRNKIGIPNRQRRGWFAASSLVVLAIVVGLIACEGAPLAPRPGLPEYREIATMPLPGPARLDVAGGNLLVSRTDLELDTQLGPFSVGAAWNSASQRWVWSFDDVTFAEGSFSDATGATHAVGTLAPGAAIPGTIWVKVSEVGPSDANRLKTKGGLVHTFTTAGHLASVHWASSPYPRLQFTQTVQGDGRLHTSAIEQCVGATPTCHPVFTIYYDAAGRVREIVDRAERRALYGYDAAGRLLTARDGLDVASDLPGYRYDYTGFDLTAITNSEGERVEYTYDTAHRLLRAIQIGEGDPTRSFVYRGADGAQLYRTIATDPLGAVRVHRYDGNYRLLSVEDLGVGETTSFTWTGRRIASRTAPSGATTHWLYANDDVIRRFDPSGNITSYGYQPNGVDRALPGRRPLLRTTDLLGTIEERRYDAAGRLVSISNGAGEALSLVYGADEMVSGFTNPAGLETLLSAYGEHGHPGAVERAGVSIPFRYDAVGNLVEGPDLDSESGPGRGGVISRVFDEDRNVASVTLAGGSFLPHGAETLVTVFRSDRRPLLIARPGGGDDRFFYDALGRLVRRSERADELWHDTTLGYDANGRIAAIEAANGHRQSWSYDSIGRINGFVIGKGSIPESFATFSWADGLLRQMFDTRSGTESYSYDESGRLDGVVYGNGDETKLSWNLRSQTTGWVLREGDGSLLRAFAIGYDGAGRERSVSDNGVEVIARTWSAGRLARTVYGNGLVREFGFDPERGVLASMTMRAGSLEIENTSITLEDPACHGLATGCVAARTTSAGGLPATSAERHHMLPGLPLPGQPLPGQRVGYEDGAGEELGEIYAYDALSNLERTRADTYRYNGERNRLQAVTRADSTDSVTYTYDPAGFATSRNGIPITWDGAGRVTSYGSATFTWDTLGRPVSRTVDGERVTHRFGGLVEVDAMGRPAAIDLGEVRIDLTGSERRFRHFDYRGNVKLVTDGNGNVVKHYEYSSYGVRAAHGDDDDSVHFARGRAAGDLVLIGHRLYDPQAARFLAPDPIHQLINQYAYTLGNPVAFWDPSGLQAVSNDQAAGAMMQAAGSALSIAGAVALGVGVGAILVPAAATTVTVVTLIGVGANLVVLGEGLKAIGSLLQSGGGGSVGFGGGFGAGPGISAPSSFNENVGPPPDPEGCGGDACAFGPGGAGGGIGEIAALAGLGGPASQGGGGGGGGCAPIALGEGGLPNGWLAVLLVANATLGAAAWRRSGAVDPIRTEHG